MAKTEHRDLCFRFNADGEEGAIAGYAAVFGERNAHDELVIAGAFRLTLEEHRAAGTRPAMFWSHNPSEVIGTWTSVTEDARGLKVEGKLLLSTTRGREVFEMLRAEAVNGISIGFRPRAATRAKDGTRELRDVELLEISLVALPSAPGARVTAHRSDSTLNTLTRAAQEAAKCFKGDTK